MINLASIFSILQVLGSVFQVLFSVATSLFAFFGGVLGPFLPA